MSASPQAASRTSAIERLGAARKELLALNTEDGHLLEQHVVALNGGEDCEPIAERRKQIATRSYHLALMIHGPESSPRLGLEWQAAFEEREALLANLDAAIVRQQQQQQVIKQQLEKVKAAEAAFYAADAELARLRNETSGTYTAGVRLENHRKAHPEIPEEHEHE